MRAYKALLKDFILRYRISRLRAFMLAGLDPKLNFRDRMAVEHAVLRFNGKPFIRAIYERRLSPTDIALWLDMPVHAVMEKIARWPVLHEDQTAPALTEEMLRTLMWRGGNPMPMARLRTGVQQPVVPARPSTRFKDSFVMYDEKFIDHMVEGEFSGFTQRWRQDAVDLLMRLSGTMGSVTATKYLNAALWRWKKDKVGFMDTPKNHARRMRACKESAS